MNNESVSSNSSEDEHPRMGLCSGSSSLASPTTDVLRNADLLGLIFSHLYIHSLEYLSSSSLHTIRQLLAGRQSLLRAGLTCKAFFGPAMSRLWYEMDSLLPLLLVIPLITQEGGEYTSTSLVKEGDLHRFKFYASQIRSLYLSSFLDTVSTHIYMAIAAALQDKTLFPALTHVQILSLDEISNENFLFLHLIAPSPLSRLEICDVMESNGIRVTSFMDDMCRLHRPHSEHLHPLYALKLEGSFLPSIGDLLQNFTRLTNLSFELTASTLRETLEISSSLSSLFDFKLEVPEESESWTLRNPVSREFKLYTFPALRNLEVGGPARYLCDVLHSIYGVYISRITITISSPDREDKQKMSKCIQRCIIMTPTLLHLHINFPEGRITMEDDLFAPFQSYRLLRSLHICSLALTHPHLVDLFDKKFGEWPVLETATLELNYLHPNCEDFDLPQISAIHLPAFSCPKLRRLESYLELPVPFFRENSQDVEKGMSWQDILESSERTNHTLTELRITFFEPDSKVPFPSLDTFMEAKEALLVARVIDHLFPNLKRLDLFGDRPRSTWKPWYRGVEKMVQHFREVRSGRPANIHST
ncbi:hypothetical protein M413DRAFT_448685 [Hebeloma cylindrosporum]|uniref:F-box domain-containing protein n=1 Tax=Hebeloma cylindrosporum TaxID=76867 RepID=A0A0C2XH60_HEBCY|nr:hypothetical protein M413DRAFT_448685 [Hebeloma cylindrosporum h7]